MNYSPTNVLIYQTMHHWSASILMGEGVDELPTISFDKVFLKWVYPT
ncbi:MAG: hypothetical protein ABI045_03585 [Flavobacteriales bacterium]